MNCGRNTQVTTAHYSPMSPSQPCLQLSTCTTYLIDIYQSVDNSIDGSPHSHTYRFSASLAFGSKWDEESDYKRGAKINITKAVMGQIKRYPLEIPNIEVLLDSARGDRLCAQGAPHLRVVEQ